MRKTGKDERTMRKAKRLMMRTVFVLNVVLHLLKTIKRNDVFVKSENSKEGD